MLSPAPGTNRSRYAATPTAPAAIAPEKPATNDVQPVRNAARPAERLAQVDVLAARLRAPRGELGVRQRARERERAAGGPDAEHRAGRGQQRGDESGRREDADADDVGDDDDRRVERAEPAVEGARAGAGHARRARLTA